jgi:hypothetical protein
MGKTWLCSVYLLRVSTGRSGRRRGHSKDRVDRRYTGLNRQGKEFVGFTNVPKQIGRVGNLG